jgi:Lon protease-like protein
MEFTGICTQQGARIANSRAISAVTLTPAFPVGAAYVPGDAVILRVFEDRYLSMMERVLQGDNTFVSVLISAGSEVGGHDQRFDTGVLVHVDHVEPAEFGIMVYAHAVQALTVTSWNNDDFYPRVEFTLHRDEELPEDEVSAVRALLPNLSSDIDRLFALMDAHNISRPQVPGGASRLIQGVRDEEIEALLWTLVRLLPSGPLARYEILSEMSLRQRAVRLLDEVTHLQEIITFRFGQ